MSVRTTTRAGTVEAVGITVTVHLTPNNASQFVENASPQRGCEK